MNPEGDEGMEEERTEKLEEKLSDVERGGRAAVDTAQRESHHLAEEAKERVESEIAARKGMIAKELGHLGNALKVSAREIEKEDSALTRPLRQAARFCEQSADSMSRKGTRELLSQVETFGREQPLVFLGAAVAAGFLATRLLRSEGKTEEVEEIEGQSTRGLEDLEGTIEGTVTETSIVEQRTHTSEAPMPAVPTTETLNVPGTQSEEHRQHGTT